jgi:hypothetical protein
MRQYWREGQDGMQEVEDDLLVRSVERNFSDFHFGAKKVTGLKKIRREEGNRKRVRRGE